LRRRNVGSTIHAVSYAEHITGEAEELRGRIDRLEAELERYRRDEDLLVKTLVSATSHAAAIREAARREAELTLRKARTEAQRRKVDAERERDDAVRESLRLRRIIAHMRTSLSAFLAQKVEELTPETETDEEARASGLPAELEAALGRVVEGAPPGLAGSSPAPISPHRAEFSAPDEYDSTGGSQHDSS
jgi:cell division septum initiation protein DivIVA